jgi:Uma2 family endonuclease
MLEAQSAGVSIQELLDNIADPELRQRLLATLQVQPQPLHMSYEDFLAWSDPEALAEWVRDEVIMATPPSYRHQNIARWLTNLLSGFAETRGLGAICQAPFQMRLEETGRAPDILFVANANLSRLKPDYLDGPADLVVEVLAPDTIGRDRGEKFYEYAAAGVREYWLINPLSDQAEFYQLDAQGNYQQVPLSEGVYHSAVLPGFWLRAAWLWQQPRPYIEPILLDIAGADYANRLLDQLQERGYIGPEPGIE